MERLNNNIGHSLMLVKKVINVRNEGTHSEATKLTSRRKDSSRIDTYNNINTTLLTLILSDLKRIPLRTFNFILKHNHS